VLVCNAMYSIQLLLFMYLHMLHFDMHLNVYVYVCFYAEVCNSSSHRTAALPCAFVLHSN
jgi:hypothetical protein